jgi:glycerophosphoryl diester phosphodiesterase
VERPSEDPGGSVHPFVEALAHVRGGVEAIAHRGGDHGPAPAENTLEAFQAAVDLGYRHLETDVHATADGVLVAFHDATLDRVTDRTGPIADLGLDEVRRARVGGHGRVPTFEELVTSFPEARFTVDLKADAAVAPMLTLLARQPGLLARVCVGSFSDTRVRAVRTRFGRAVCTSAGPRDVLALRARTAVHRRLALGRRAARRAVAHHDGRPTFAADLLQVPERFGPVPIVERRLLDVAATLGVPVHVWTVNDPARMSELVDRGVAGIVTDAVEPLKGLLERRGAW